MSDRLQKDSRRLFTMSATGAKPKRVVAGNEPNFQMVPDWQPLRLGAGRRRRFRRGHRCPNGVVDKVDPLYDQADAWSLKMEPGTTYRVNLSPRKGCARSGVYPPATRSFASGRRVAYPRVRRLLHADPGPDGGGTYSPLVFAQPGPRPSSRITSRAAAQPNNQARESRSTVTRTLGSLSGIERRRRRPVPLRCQQTEHGPGSPRPLPASSSRSPPRRHADRPYNSWVDTAKDAQAGHPPARGERSRSRRRKVHAGTARSPCHQDDPDRRAGKRRSPSRSAARSSSRPRPHRLPVEAPSAWCSNTRTPSLAGSSASHGT